MPSVANKDLKARFAPLANAVRETFKPRKSGTVRHYQGALNYAKTYPERAGDFRDDFENFCFSADKKALHVFLEAMQKHVKSPKYALEIMQRVMPKRVESDFSGFMDRHKEVPAKDTAAMKMLYDNIYESFLQETASWDARTVTKFIVMHYPDLREGLKAYLEDKNTPDQLADILEKTHQFETHPAPESTPL